MPLAFPRGCLLFVTGWRHHIEGNCFLWHSHTSFELVYHLRGKGESQVENGESFEFPEGCVAIYPPGVAHRDAPIPPAEDVCIHFQMDGAPPEELRQTIRIEPPLDIVMREDILHLARTPSQGFAAEQLALNHRVTALIIQLLQLARSRRNLESSSPKRAIVAQAQAYIQTHFDQIDSIKEVARHVGVSHHYLRHLFAPACGMSVIGWINKVRLERAKDLLVNSNLPLKSIAGMCGFRSEQYFLKRFREGEGLTPGSFRRSKQRPLN